MKLDATRKRKLSGFASTKPNDQWFDLEDPRSSSVEPCPEQKVHFAEAKEAEHCSRRCISTLFITCGLFMFLYPQINNTMARNGLFSYRSGIKVVKGGANDEFAILDDILFLVFHSSAQQKNTDGIAEIKSTWANANAPYLRNAQSKLPNDFQFHINFISTESQPFVTQDSDVMTPPFEQLSNGESATALLWALKTLLVDKKSAANSQRNLIAKRRTARNPPKYKWVFKLDDVSFVHIPNLVAFLHSLNGRVTDVLHSISNANAGESRVRNWVQSNRLRFGSPKMDAAFLSQNGNGLDSTSKWRMPPLWVGCPLKKTGTNVFTFGGSGYLLNERIVEAIIDGFQSGTLTVDTCAQNRNFLEDICMADVLRNHLKYEALPPIPRSLMTGKNSPLKLLFGDLYSSKEFVNELSAKRGSHELIWKRPIDTRDYDGVDTFNVFEPLSLLGIGGIYRLSTVDWFHEYHWYQKMTVGQMSKSPVSFHYVQKWEMRPLFHLLFNERRSGRQFKKSIAKWFKLEDKKHAEALFNYSISIRH